MNLGWNTPMIHFSWNTSLVAIDKNHIRRFSSAFHFPSYSCSNPPIYMMFCHLRSEVSLKVSYSKLPSAQAINPRIIQNSYPPEWFCLNSLSPLLSNHQHLSRFFFNQIYFRHRSKSGWTYWEPTPKTTQNRNIIFYIRNLLFTIPNDILNVRYIFSWHVLI